MKKIIWAIGMIGAAATAIAAALGSLRRSWKRKAVEFRDMEARGESFERAREIERRMDDARANEFDDVDSAADWMRRFRDRSRNE